jgi:hypothetical protein
MYFPWYDGAMLALESNTVVALRMMKLASGGSEAFREAHLMIEEKVDAAFEAMDSLFSGGTPTTIIDRYRVHVAANAKRLSPD